MSQVSAILIAGPTTSGKSALAARLARALGDAVVVNADSMQVYADLRVLTARPGPEEMAALPHALYGHVDGAANYSVGRYVEDLARVLSELEAAGVRPILVGGTGLYFKALTEGLSDMPPVPDDVRERVRRGAAGRPTPELHADLARLDPEAAGRLRPSDRLRVLRALEVFAATGRSVLSFHGTRRPGPLTGKPSLRIVLHPERDEVRGRIDARFAAMVREGALEEAAALAARALDPALPVMRAHGVPGLLAHLRGEATLAEAVERGQRDTRAYAKRQFTWARTQMPDWLAVPPEQAFAAALDALRRTD